MMVNINITIMIIVSCCQSCRAVYIVASSGWRRDRQEIKQKNRENQTAKSFAGQARGGSGGGFQAW